eukprot:6712103-Pyramimonas_sp.AAC.1
MGLGGRRGRGMSDKTRLKFDEFRREMRMPARDARGGRAYSSKLSYDVKQILGSRKMELLDIAATYTGAVHGDVSEHAVTDLSQSASRCMYYLNGKVGTPTTSQELFHMGRQRYVVAPEVFQMQGWDLNMGLKFDGLNFPRWRHLTGNMMCLPCVGAVAARILDTVSLGEGKNYS